MAQPSLYSVGQRGVDVESQSNSSRSELTTGAAGAVAGSHRINLSAANSALDALHTDPDPKVVFGQLAGLCVPGVCDEMHVAVVATGDAGEPRTSPPAHPATRNRRRSHGADRDPAKFSAVVRIAGGPEIVDGFAAYTVSLTCSWWLHQPTREDLASIEMLGRSAAALVSAARHSAALTKERRLVENLRVALDSNRMISAAVGVLMAHHQVTYEDAFTMLGTVSQARNQKISALAAEVLYTGDLPA